MGKKEQGRKTWSRALRKQRSSRLLSKQKQRQKRNVYVSLLRKLVDRVEKKRSKNWLDDQKDGVMWRSMVQVGAEAGADLRLDQQ